MPSKNYYGFAHELPKKDKRQVKWKEQRKKRGFDDTEVWALDCSITSFILPRLKCFRQTHASFPAGLTNDEWNVILDKMILAFELNVIKLDKIVLSRKEYQYHKQGMKLFGMYFMDLWS